MNQTRRLLLAGVILLTLLAGLNPEDFDFRNHANWIPGENGIEFDIYGAATSEPFITERFSERLEREGFTLEIAVAGLDRTQRSFASIVQIHGGDDATQWVLGHWTNRLIVMNGDDYRRRRKTPRIAFKLPGKRDGDHLITISSGPSGTRIHFDGKMVEERPDLVTTIPGAPRKGRLILGNSADGTHPWQGIARGMVLYTGVPTEPEALRRYDQWRAADWIPPADQDGSFAVYGFDEQQGSVARDRSVHENDLQFSYEQVIADERVLQSPLHETEWNLNTLRDIVINLLGFMPLGLALSWVLQGSGLTKKGKVVVVLLAATALSFGIELLQAWMPSRASSSRDLILNVLGAILGLMVFVLAERFRSGRARSDSPNSA